MTLLAPAPTQSSGVRPAVVELRDAGKRFGSTWVVRGVSFAVEPGTIFGLFGPSGAGKTTTIRMLLGLLGLDEGEIRVLGVPPDEFDAKARARIGYMPQLFVLYPELSVNENLNLVASLYRLGLWRRRKPMREALELVELWQHRGKTARSLSGGMQRRLALAAALLHDPELIVVDEPTAGIDPILRAKFWEHFRSLRERERTLVVTSQYVTEADNCDQVAIVGHGKVLASGTPAELRRQAMGGDIVDLVTDGLSIADLEMLNGLEAVRTVQRISAEQVQLTVESAGSAIPRVISALTARGVEVKHARENQPNFEEVFVRLVAQANVPLME